MDGNEKDTKQNNGQKIKRSAKRRNPNLRLVKSGDKPVKEENSSKGVPPSFGEKEAVETKKAVQKGKKEAEETKKSARKGKEEQGETKKAAQEKSSVEGEKGTGETKKSIRRGKKKRGAGKLSKGKKKEPEEEKKSAEGKAKRTGKKAKSEGEKAETGKKVKPEGEKTETGKKAKPGGEKTEGGKKAKPGGEKAETGKKTKPKGEAKETGEKQTKKAEGKAEQEGGTKKAKEKALSEEETKENGEKEKLEKEKKKTGKRKKKPGQKKGKTGKKPDNGNAEKKRGLKPDIRKKDRDIYRDKLELGEWFVQHRSLVIIGFTVFACCALLAGIYHYITTAYEVTTVYVDGNVHYTNEEVMELVMKGKYGKNSLYLSMKYKDKGVEGIPFIEKMDVNILAPNTIRISVYEKALAGYVEYLGRYMYFDRDGTVVESSAERTRGIPQVTGLRFDYVVVNEPLPVENDEIFKRILDITQLLNKYELMADKIFFDSSYDLTLFFEDIRVTLGSSSDIDQKIIRLKNILPELEGKSGTLQMENYTKDTKNITFHQE